MEIQSQRVAVISGGNRGIGFEVCRQLGQQGMTVVLGARDAAQGESAAGQLRADGLEIRAHQLDVTSQQSVDELARWIDGELGRVDVLVNNAGIYPGGKASTLDLTVAEQAWQVNALGAWRLANALIPFMQRGRWGRIVNVSSQAGSLTRMSGSMPGYNVSKVALNGVTKVLAADLSGSGILVNSVCPGWVATDMGGQNAPRTPSQGAASVVWAALLPDDGPNGGFFRDGNPVPW